MGEAKPTLHEIAAMPFPHSERALQRWYGVEPYRERSPGQTKTFRVEVSYSWTESGSVTYEVEAASEDEANALAEEMFATDTSIDAGDDVEINDVFADEVLQ